MVRIRFIAALVLALGATSTADIITMKDGRTIEGEITQEDGKVIKVKVKSGSLSIDPKDVASIERKLTPGQEYKERLAKLDAKNASKVHELGAWADAHEMEKEAVQHFLDAWKLDPTVKATSDALEKHDWHLVNGAWQDPDSYYPSKGYLKLDGKWLAPMEHAWRMQLKEVAKITATRDTAKSTLGTATAKSRKAAADLEKETGKAAELESDILALRTDKGEGQIAQRHAENELSLANAELARLDPSDKTVQNQKKIQEAKRVVSAAKSLLEKKKTHIANIDKVISIKSADAVAAKVRANDIEKEQPKLEADITAAQEAILQAEAALPEATEKASALKSAWEKSNPK